MTAASSRRQRNPCAESRKRWRSKPIETPSPPNISSAGGFCVPCVRSYRHRCCHEPARRCRLGHPQRPVGGDTRVLSDGGGRHDRSRGRAAGPHHRPSPRAGRACANQRRSGTHQALAGGADDPAQGGISRTFPSAVWRCAAFASASPPRPCSLGRHGKHSGNWWQWCAS